MSVSVEEVQRIAKLARLQFSEDEERALADDLSDILSYMDQLEELDTTGVPPMSHVLDMQNVLREDEVDKRMSQSDALKHASDTEDGYVRVPRSAE